MPLNVAALPFVPKHGPVNNEFSPDEELKASFPLGMEVNVFVTNVYNNKQLRFFMFVENANNAQHFANIHDATTPPIAYKCLSMPREGIIFGLRLGESIVLRAIRISTMCITASREVFLPDVGRSIFLKTNEMGMYHLPWHLRQRPGLAVACQLRGINDNVTILKGNMQTVIRGLLFRSVTLRVDGYIGNVLKVQLINADFAKLKQWTAELGKEENDFRYALKHVILCKPKSMDPSSLLHDNFCYKRNESRLATIEEDPSSSDGTEEMNKEEDKNDSKNMHHQRGFPVVPPLIGNRFTPTVSRVTHWTDYPRGERILATDLERYLKNLQSLENIKPKSLRPVLADVSLPENSWKRNYMPSLVIVDKRNVKLSFLPRELLTVTFTHVGQMDRFFGVIHRPNRSYMQHMWTDDLIPKRSRFSESRTPYLFDVVLAKHSSDFKWYRAKVIEILKNQRKVLVFFVDYGGVESVNLWDTANLSSSISKLPFQATLFRIHDLVDVTTTKVEHELGVDILRRALLKNTFNVRVINYTNDEATILIEDNQFPHPYSILKRKGFMRSLGKTPY